MFRILKNTSEKHFIGVGSKNIKKNNKAIFYIFASTPVLAKNLPK